MRSLPMSPVLLAALLALAGCSDDESEAKILDSKHAGWRQPNCGDCHRLPEEEHTQTQPPQCAACHGGNGACDPNGPNSGKKDHARTLACGGCHKSKHGFSGQTACVSCHFASAGVIPCGLSPDAGPTVDLGPPPDGGGDGTTLSKNLKSNCLTWPATPFSPTNKTAWKTSVSRGQRAVEFTLKDVNGKAYTLSSLLASRPVWLQLGSYT